MKHVRFIAMMLFAVMLTFMACGGDGGGEDASVTVINIFAIPGVTPPNYGETPVTAITETVQYTGTVSWSPSDATFAATTVYTATITLTAKPGYTLTGVAENFFTVAGATSVTNPIDSGVVTAVFSQTGVSPATVINISAITGIIPPVLGEIPVTTITETAQYTGTVTWDGSFVWCKRFAGQKSYTATITLTVKSGYTLTGVTGNFFTVAGATTVTNSANSNMITAVFPATASVGSIGDSKLGGKVAYILVSGDPGYVAGEQRGLIAATADQSTGIIWAIAAYQSTSVSGTGTAIGTGSSNTDKIIAQNGTGSTYAAGLARACTDGGYADWYLPSKDELNQLYLNRTAIGGFVASCYYWSSSEVDATIAWLQGFGVVGFNDQKNNSTARVRAVRSF